MRWIERTFFRRVPLSKVLADQLFEAERLHAEHLAAAEMHFAMAGVYGARVLRIKKTAQPELRAVR